MRSRRQAHAPPPNPVGAAFAAMPPLRSEKKRRCQDTAVQSRFPSESLDGGFPFPSPGPPQDSPGKSRGVGPVGGAAFAAMFPAWGSFRRDGLPPSRDRKAVPGHRNPENLECGDLSPLWLLGKRCRGTALQRGPRGTEGCRLPLRGLLQEGERVGTVGAPSSANSPAPIVTGRFPSRGPQGGFLRKPPWGGCSPLRGLLRWGSLVEAPLGAVFSLPGREATSGHPAKFSSPSSGRGRAGTKVPRPASRRPQGLSAAAEGVLRSARKLLWLGLVGWILAASTALRAAPIPLSTSPPPGDAGPSNTFRPSVSRAVLLAGLLPGGGAFYLRQPVKGLLFAGVELVPLALAGRHYRTYRATGDRTELQTAFGWFILFIGTKLFAMADSYVTAKLWDFQEALRQVEQDVQVPPGGAP